jgi:7,8-dihydropterin-6-yl-methyl-4-(beta-D-ribofuranosyl)aminobenzene 5'-phosphate synthase
MKRAGGGRVGRRDLVRGGGAAALAAALDSLFGPPIPARALQTPVSVPEVDRLAVRVVVDSYQIAVAPSFSRDNVQVERFGWPLSDAPPDKALVSEFGLSMHVESRKGDQTRNVLVDFGFTSNALNNNLELLGVDPATLDALVLTTAITIISAGW